MAKPQPAATTTTAKWYEPQYRNGGKMEDYLGNTQPSLVEVVAVRLWQALNGGVSLDWEYQNCTVATIRTLAPGFRMAYLLTGVYLVVLSLWFLEVPIVFRHELNNDNPTMRFANVTLGAAFFLWALDFATLAVAWWFVARVDRGSVFDGLCGCFNCFVPNGPRIKRGERVNENVCTGLLFALVYAAAFVLGVISTHTILTHVYRERNVWFAVLLCAQTLMLLISSLGDACSIGSPWGIQQSSRVASILLSFRSIVLMPMTVIWTVAAIVASFPPSECVTC